MNNRNDESMNIRKKIDTLDDYLTKTGFVYLYGKFVEYDVQLEALHAYVGFHYTIHPVIIYNIISWDFRK